MGQQTLAGTDLTERRRQYRAPVNEGLLDAADSETWPTHEYHCFARVVLDNVSGAEWTVHVRGRPAYKHLSRRELAAAVPLAERMLTQGAPLVKRLDERSLWW